MFAVSKMVARRSLVRNAALMAVVLPTLLITACAEPAPPPPAAQPAPPAPPPVRPARG